MVNDSYIEEIKKSFPDDTRLIQYKLLTATHRISISFAIEK